MVIDTMVFVYALLGVEDFRDDATKILERADTITVPDSSNSHFSPLLRTGFCFGGCRGVARGWDHCEPGT